jgi:hypothetical protein
VYDFIERFREFFRKYVITVANLKIKTGWAILFAALIGLVLRKWSHGLGAGTLLDLPGSDGYSMPHTYLNN